MGIRFFVSLFLSLFGGAYLHAEAKGRWLGPDNKYLPFLEDSEILNFLENAEIVSRKKIPQGINKPIKLRLRRGGVEANAIFRTVNIRKSRHETKNNVIIDFHDSYIYECAAYTMSRILGIDHIPPCVLRHIGGRNGTVQLWVENAITEIDRRKRKERAPVSIVWVRQYQTMRLFDALIYNSDRNQGNILIDQNWKIWFIDHTRSFHRSERVENIDRIIWIERDMWDRIKSLDFKGMRSEIGYLVDDDRIKHVIKRRDVIVNYIGNKIESIGEDSVLYDIDEISGDIEDNPDYDKARSIEDIPEESLPLEGGG